MVKPQIDVLKITTPLPWGDNSKIAWTISSLVEKSIPNPTLKSGKSILIDNYFYRDFAPLERRTAYLKPADKREDGLIAFNLRGVYELNDADKEGSFAYNVTFPYYIDEAGDYVADQNHLIIDDPMPRQSLVTGDNAVVLTGIACLKVDGRDKAATSKYVMIAPTISVPNASSYKESGNSWGGQMGGGVSVFFKLIEFDLSGNYTRTSTKGTSESMPANTFVPGSIRLDLNVASKTFPRPVPTPLPLDLASITLMAVFFAKNDESVLDARIKNEIGRWFDRISQFEDGHKDLPSILDGVRKKKITLFANGFADARGSQTDEGRAHNIELSDARARNIGLFLKKPFGSLIELNTAGRGNKTAKWKIEFDKRRGLVLKPRDQDRSVVIWMEFDEVEKYLRGQIK